MGYNKEKAKEYYQKNKEKIKERNLIYYQKNKDYYEYKLKAKEYREKNKEKAKENYKIKKLIWKEIIMNNNEIYLKLKSIFDIGNIEYCPKCYEISNIISNPMYYWKCNNCGYECDYRNLPIKSVKEQVIDMLNEINNEEIIKDENKPKLQKHDFRI